MSLKCASQSGLMLKAELLSVHHAFFFLIKLFMYDKWAVM